MGREVDEMILNGVLSRFPDMGGEANREVVMRVLTDPRSCEFVEEAGRCARALRSLSLESLDGGNFSQKDSPGWKLDSLELNSIEEYRKMIAIRIPEVREAEMVVLRAYLDERRKQENKVISSCADLVYQGTAGYKPNQEVVRDVLDDSKSVELAIEALKKSSSDMDQNAERIEGVRHEIVSRGFSRLKPNEMLLLGFCLRRIYPEMFEAGEDN